MAIIDIACIYISLFMLYKTTGEFRRISLVIFMWFLTSNLAFNYLAIDLRMYNHWVIFVIYNVINLFVMLFLFIENSHRIISAVILTNIVLNIVASRIEVVKNADPLMYNIYITAASALSIAALRYQWMLTDGNRHRISKVNMVGNFSNFLWRRNWLLYRQEA